MCFYALPAIRKPASMALTVLCMSSNLFIWECVNTWCFISPYRGMVCSANTYQYLLDGVLITKQELLENRMISLNRFSNGGVFQQGNHLYILIHRQTDRTHNNLGKMSDTLETRLVGCFFTYINGFWLSVHRNMYIRTYMYVAFNPSLMTLWD